VIFSWQELLRKTEEPSDSRREKPYVNKKNSLNSAEVFTYQHLIRSGPWNAPRPMKYRVNVSALRKTFDPTILRHRKMGRVGKGERQVVRKALRHRPKEISNKVSSYLIEERDFVKPRVYREYALERKNVGPHGERLYLRRTGFVASAYLGIKSPIIY
jgi:hypothetical protein